MAASALRCRVVFPAEPGYFTGMRRCRLVSLAALTLALLSAAAAGETAKCTKPGGIVNGAATAPTERLGAAQSWTAYAYNDKSGKVCYLLGNPQKSEPPHSKRKHPV